MSPRLIRIAAPLLAALTAAFGVYYIYAAAYAANLRNWPFTAFYALFGFGGLALATALWRTSRGLRQR